MDFLHLIDPTHLVVYLIIGSGVFILIDRTTDSLNYSVILSLLCVTILILQDVFVKVSLFDSLFTFDGLSWIHCLIMALLSFSFLLTVTNRFEKDLKYYYGIVVSSFILSILLMKGSHYIQFDIGLILENI